MASVVYTPLTQVPGCSKCSKPRKDHPLPYSANCTLALMGESMNDSRDTLLCSEEALEVPHLHSQSVVGKPEDLVAEPVPPEPVGQGSGTLAPTAAATTALPASTTTTTTTGVLMECAIAVSSSRLLQQGEERAKDRCHIVELSW